MKYYLYVTDWAPNGTNGLVVRDSEGVQVDYRDEVLFGVNVSKLGPAKHFEGHEYSPEWRIPKRLVKKHVASSPIDGTFEDNCRWLAKYLKPAKRTKRGGK